MTPRPDADAAINEALADLRQAFARYAEPPADVVYCRCCGSDDVHELNRFGVSVCVGFTADG